MKELSKTYNPKNVEDKWYKKWEEDKAFSPNDNSKIPMWIEMGQLNIGSLADV